MSDWKPQETPNFPVSDMACKCGKCGGVANMGHDFMLKLQVMRDIVGKPFVITSGYRCAQHPEELRKAKPGSHNQGTAADIATGDGLMRYEVIKAALEVGMVGLGIANGFIHVDSGHKYATRPVQWKY
jgi:zinc D-Ala-D-Ala carboxypeptidase